MKPIRHILLALILSLPILAHGADNVPDAARTVSERVVEPSPDVATMRRYTDCPVSYATGSASVDIPLMSLSTPSLSVSLGLSYRCEAKKVEEPAGWVGLGWTLTGLGSVSRQICGMPDDWHLSPFDFRKYSSDANYYNDLIKSRADANYDRYTLVTPEGECVQFIIDNGTVKQLGFSEILIERTAPADNPHATDKFVVTTPHGFVYEYSEKEWVEFHYSPSPETYYRAVTAWHLTRITPPGNGDPAVIEYSRGTEWAKHVSKGLYSASYSWPGSGASYGGDVGEYHRGEDYHRGPVFIAGASPTANTTYLSPPLPKRAVCENGVIEFEFESEGFESAYENGSAERLSHIRLKNPSGETVRDVELSAYRSFTSRRMLGSVAINGDAGEIDSYEFLYYTDNSCYGDIFGYANEYVSDPSGNSVLGEDLKIRESRKISPKRLNAGLLEEMISSSGMHTKFEYEPSVAHLGGSRFIWDSEIAVGTRIKSITAEDEVSGRWRKRQFEYSGDTLSMDLHAFGISSFLAPSGTCTRSPIEAGKYGNFNMSVVFTSSSRQAGMPFEGMKVYYGAVEETVSGTGMDRPVTTRYEYDLQHCILKKNPCGSAVINDYEDPNTAICNPWLTAKGGYKSENERNKYGQVFKSHLQTQIFRENIGGMPLLKTKTVYESYGGARAPRYREEFDYSVSRRNMVPVGLYYETVIYKIQTTGSSDITDAAHVTHGVVLADFCKARCTDVRRTTFYMDGRYRETSERRRYSMCLVPGEDSIYRHPGYFADSVGYESDRYRDRPLLVSYSHGGDTITRYDLYSGDIDKDFFNKLPDRYLPVAQKWVAHGRGYRDSLQTDIHYGNFHGKTRPVRETVSRQGAVLDMAAYTNYDALGLPTAMTRRDGSEYAVAWDAYGNLLSKKHTATGLESRYTHRQLVGCTSVTYPSGRRRSFGYADGRLAWVRNSGGDLVASYSYGNAFGRGGNWENHITTTAYTGSGQAVTKAVYDGFGMKTADIFEDFGGGGENVVTATEYDALDRAVKLWQPAPADTAAAAGFYGDTRPWTDYIYDSDGSERVVSTTAPGKDMIGHPATAEYLCNTQSGELRCRRFVLDGERLTDKGAYADASLDVVRAIDADGHRVLTFSDWRGRTVLVRKVLAEGKYIDTYTVYDHWGNVAVVLQPMAEGGLKGGSYDISDGGMDEVIEKYAYVYRYDDALRPVYAKLPGCDPVTTVYDPDGLVAYTVDGNLRAKGNARFTLYDAAARPVVTGICNEPTGVVPRMRATLDTSANGLDKTGYTTEATLGGVKVLTATYYDGYDCLALSQFESIPDNFRPSGIRAPGLVTASLDRVLSGTLNSRSAKYVATVTGYDSEEHPTRVAVWYPESETAMLTENVYNIDGTVASSINTLQHPTGDHTDSHTYAYDAAGRLVKETVSYDGGEAVDVQKLSYNAIGTLSGNDLGVFNEEYTYNVRGAMTKRKSAVFEQNISFAGKYNGSISSIKDNISGGLALTGYYTYDKAGRLTQASMTVGGAPRYIDYTYDLNSNITTLVRDGDDGIDPIAWIDNLAYTYDGNKVRKINDSLGQIISERTMNFVDGADLDVEYTYDRNGNMTGDANKGLEMSWDYNNRLYKVEDDEMTMTFNRTGSGQKLGKSVYVGPKPKYPFRPLFRSPIRDIGGTFIPVDTVVEAGTTVSTDYFGAYEYVNGKFSRFNTATGYRDSVGTHVYVRDWQGNIRAVVRKGDDGSTVLEQATYYYPYGMPMAESTNPTANRYKYTGKELLTNKGFNCYDYGARFYDPATCIWLSADPLAHEDYGTSPFVFCGANPINRVDRNGKIWETIWDVGNVVYDVVAATYCHIDGDHEAAKGHWVDAGADVVAAIIPFVPAGASKVAKASAEVVESTVKAANKADNVVDVGKGLKNAERIKEGKAFEQELLQQAIDRGEDVVAHVTLVPKNGLGNVKGNRINTDQLIRNNDGTFGITEAKLTDTTPLSPGQKKAMDHVVNGNGKFECRSDINAFGIKKGEEIEVSTFKRINKYTK